jgi:hypothetical protein
MQKMQTMLQAGGISAILAVLIDCAWFDLVSGLAC